MFSQEELREAQIHQDERLLLSPPKHTAALLQSPYNTKSQRADPAGGMRPPEAVKKGDDNPEHSELQIPLKNELSWFGITHTLS